MRYTLKLDELIFAAGQRCFCRAGLARPLNLGPFDERVWSCSRKLLGIEDEGRHITPRSMDRFEYAIELADGNPSTRPGGLPEDKRAWLTLRYEGAQLKDRLVEVIERSAANLDAIEVSKRNLQRLAALYGSPADAWDALAVFVNINNALNDNDIVLVITHADEIKAVAR